MYQLTYEQAVYGSFAFREGGYGLLAHSPRCDPEWLAGFESACQKFGEPPGGAVFERAVFSQKILAKGVWMIVGVSPTGQDDRGRPGALAFHGLFVKEREFQKIEFDPFRLINELRSDWSASTKLTSISRPVPARNLAIGPNSERIQQARTALIAGRRVAIESPEPIEEMARKIWAELPENVRKRTSMSTWAFANGNRFDLVAVPRLEAIEWDASYAEPVAKTVSKRWSFRRPTRALTLAFSVVVLAGLIAWGWKAVHAPSASRPIDPIPIAHSIGPDRASYRNEISDRAEMLAVTQGLTEFAERFGIPLDGDPPDPTTAMIRLANRLRYRGPLLTDFEQIQLAKQNVPGRSRAMVWDAHIRQFAADRPLPRDFEQGPLRWKLDTFAWSFHINPNPRLFTAEIPRAMQDALTLDEPAGANPLASKYPVLADYARFLARLPRR